MDLGIALTPLASLDWEMLTLLSPCSRVQMSLWAAACVNPVWNGCPGWPGSP